MVETMENPLKVDFPFTVPTPLIERLKATTEAAVEFPTVEAPPAPEGRAVDVVA